ncbi:MAG: nitrous oxide reductase accessory protein NosL [Deltaproteobacteria bacterium]|nr:nitrous oxide reductase accessory protein NosL [Deltaproteobacteria bacterium]
MHRWPRSFNHIVSVYVAFLIFGCFPTTSVAEDSVKLPDGSILALPQKCPVCGMMIGGPSGPSVAVTYKNGHITGFEGVAAAVFKDGHVVGFEGARCLFIYNCLPKKFNVDINDIAHQYVTDFVSKELINLSEAYLVLGSQVKGPMGYDLIAFTNKDNAADFARKYDGKWIVQLHEIPKVRPKQGADTDATVNRGVSGAKGIK